MSKQGEYVGIEFASADATTAAAVTLKDANGATRTLAAHERLLIDTLTCALAAAVLLAEIFNDDGDGNVEAGERIAAFAPTNAGSFDGGAEGFSCGVGTTPKVKATVAGTVTLTGTGRIIKGKSEGLRPSWREAL